MKDSIGSYVSIGGIRRNQYHMATSVPYIARFDAVHYIDGCEAFKSI